MQFRLQSEIFSNPPRQTIIYLLKIPIYEFVSNENRDREKIMFLRCCFSTKIQMNSFINKATKIFFIIRE